MTTFTLEGQIERVAAHNPFSTLEHTPLYHQLRTFEALERSHLVVNTYNTGTGKTMAALLHLFRLSRLNGTRKNVLFIAPTNALIGQHAADIREFVRKNKLDFFVAEVNAAALRKMANDRSGETLYRLITNPLTYYEWLGLPANEHRKRPLVVVVSLRLATPGTSCHVTSVVTQSSTPSHAKTPALRGTARRSAA